MVLLLCLTIVSSSEYKSQPAAWIGEGDSYKIQKNERIAQLLITPIPKSQFKEVDFENLGETERGEGGFGSTGRF